MSKKKFGLRIEWTAPPSFTPMVGFGSSLRIARRPGWEGAYLDYETLKLLLSQIEAVYEEEGHSRRRRSDTVFDPGDEDRKSKRVSLRDYRDELFLASDSDDAYLSVDDSNEDFVSSESSTLEDKTNSLHSHSANHAQHHSNTVMTKNPTGQPFLLSYSKEPSSSDENESSCGARVYYSFPSWPTWEKPSSSIPEIPDKKGKFRKSTMNHLPEEDAFYMDVEASNTVMGQHAFYMSTTVDEDNRYRTNSRHSSFLNAPVMSTRESSSLLPATSTPSPAGNSLFNVSSSGTENTTPPMPMYGALTQPLVDSTGSILGSNHGGTSVATVEQQALDPSSMNASPILPPRIAQHHQIKKQWQLLEDRKRERRQRRNRRKRLRAIRRERERKTPNHLRLAHSNARAITERFLGLLRAETEKVMLFAQSRLGELADTAGSLRFSNIDDFDSNNSINQHNDHRSHTAFGYPLSDAGLHPSASSSEDSGQGTWSDTSDENKKGDRRPTVFAIGSDEQDAVRIRKSQGKRKAANKKTSSKSEQHSNGSRVQEYANAAALRQIAHFTELRKRRPIFLRNDQILGEDMLLISAVEEVDGYTAVGVELLHVLRFICVNLIAVRKICAKHDRLLMNRMLGGYYHRTRMGPQAIEDARTLGGLIARNSGDIYEAQ